MKAFVVFAAVLACAYAKPQLIYSNGLGLGGITLGGIQYAASPYTYAAAPVAIAPAVTSSQYHAQDELGQFSYGYAGGPSAKSESKDAFGNVRGAYSYIDANGIQQTVNYVADPVNGFRVAATNLPVANLVGPAPVQDTPEVAAARAAHQKAIEEAQVRNAEAEKKDAAEGQDPQEPIEVPATLAAAPLPVQDTPEVAAAKISHQQAVNEAVARSGRKKRGIVAPITYSGLAPYYGGAILGANTLTYAAPAVSYSTHSIVPAVTYAAHPAITYAAQPAVIAQAQPLRAATLTKVVNTPGHAVSYRVD